MTDGFGTGGFAGGRARALAEINPVGQFFAPIERALERRQRRQEFERSAGLEEQRIEIQRETAEVQREQFKLAREADTLKFKRENAAEALELLTTFGKNIGEIMQTQGDIPPSVLAQAEAQMEATTRALGEAGFDDPAGRALRQFEAARGGASRMSPEAFRQFQSDLFSQAMASVFERDMEPEQARAIMLAQVGNDPAMQKFVNQIFDVEIPGLMERRAQEGRAEAAGDLAQLGEFRKAGIPEDVALRGAIGGVSTQINIGDEQPAPGTIAPKLMGELQTEFLQVRQIRPAVASLRADLTPEVVGVVGAIIKTIGGLGQQIPGVKQLMDMTGIFDEASVTAARAYASKIQQTVAKVAPILSAQGGQGRIANQQVERTIQALEAGDAFATAESAQAIFDDLDALALESEKSLEKVIRSGNVFDAPGLPVSGEPQSPEGEDLTEAEITRRIKAGDLTLVGVEIDELDDQGNVIGSFMFTKDGDKIPLTGSR